MSDEVDEIRGVSPDEESQDDFKRRSFIYSEAKASVGLLATKEDGQLNGETETLAMIYVKREGDPYAGGGISENDEIFLIPDNYWSAITLATSAIQSMFGDEAAAAVFSPGALGYLKSVAERIDREMEDKGKGDG